MRISAWSSYVFSSDLSADRDTTRLSQHQRRLHVAIDEYFLDRGLGRPVFGQQNAQFLLNLQQALRHRAAGGTDAAGGDHACAPAFRFDDAVAGVPRSRIDADDADQGVVQSPPRSAFEYTFCTSSCSSSMSISFCTYS